MLRSGKNYPKRFKTVTQKVTKKQKALQSIDLQGLIFVSGGGGGT